MTNTNKNETRMPSGPSGRLPPTFALLRDPRGAFERWRDCYGDPFFVHALNGPVVITGRPELVRQIFTHDPADFDVFALQTGIPVLGSGSMLLLSGEAHRRERKLVMPMFHGDRMRAYASIMAESANRAAKKHSPGATVALQDLMTDITLDVIVHAIFGGEDAESVDRLVTHSREMTQRLKPMLLFSAKTHFGFFGLSPWDRFRQAQAKLNKAFDAEIEKRQHEPAAREDILSLLMQAHYEDGSPILPEHVRDELATFLFAGHETSAIAMTWAVYHLLHNPDVLQRLVSELTEAAPEDPTDFAKLPYLKAVLQETLRLNPIVPEVLRILKSPMDLGEYRLPAGTAVAPATILSHYCPKTFPEPNVFRPERFLDRTFSSSEYFPFGGGHRRCAGAAFANYEMAIALGTLLTQYRFELISKQKVSAKRRNVTMGPGENILVKLTRR